MAELESNRHFESKASAAENFYSHGQFSNPEKFPPDLRALGIDDGDTLCIRHFPFCEGHLLVKNDIKIIPTKFLLNRWIE